MQGIAGSIWMTSRSGAARIRFRAKPSHAEVRRINARASRLVVCRSLDTWDQSCRSTPRFGGGISKLIMLIAVLGP
jgi:hypothetical protein